MKWVTSQLFNLKLDSGKLSTLLGDIFASQNQLYGLRDALDWAEGFLFPDDIENRDLTRLQQSAGSIVDMTVKVQRDMRKNRLNSFRIANCVPDTDPDHALVLDLVSGIRVFRKRDFIPNGKSGKVSVIPKLRAKYKQASSVINKLIYELHKLDLVYILPKSAILETKLCHLSVMHWGPKWGKKFGRILLDASDDTCGALNDEENSDAAEAFYGRIILPTIHDIVRMILQFEDEMEQSHGSSFNRSSVILYKNDLQRAFMLLNFLPDVVPLLCAELTNDLVLVHHSGLFGLGTMPFAFNVISRVLERNLNNLPTSFTHRLPDTILKQLGYETRESYSRISNTLAPIKLVGKVALYVDDAIAVTLDKSLHHDNTLVQTYFTTALGPVAVADTKYVAGRRIEVIGWTVDLDKRVVTIALKNFYKVAFAFLDIDLEKNVQVQTLQKLASLGSRYALIIRIMIIFNAYLYANYVGIRSNLVYVKWKAQAKIAVQLWRATLIHLNFNESSFAKPLDSFRASTPSVVILFDSSLSGTGVIVREHRGVDNQGKYLLGPVLAICSYSFDYLNLGSDSSYQNFAEFLGVVMGLLILKDLGLRHMSICLRGDSKTALRWSETERFRTVFANMAALTYLGICLQFGFDIHSTEFVEGTSNLDCDRLSRGVSAKTLCDEGFCSADKIWEPKGTSVEIIKICDPRQQFEDLSGVLTFWKHLKTLLDVAEL